MARTVAKLLGKPVKKLDDCVGPLVQKNVERLKPGQLLLLENTRFHPEEQKNDAKFAHELAKAGELIVFDAFGQAHRIHASTTGILQYKPAVAGLLLEKEINTISSFIEKPKKPFVLILGGAKISDKVDIINHLLSRCDTMLVGGGVANTFLKASGTDVGSSLVESSFVNQAKAKKTDSIVIARKILRNAAKSKTNLILPQDFIAAESSTGRGKKRIFKVGKSKALTANEMLLDIGPATTKMYRDIIHRAGSVVWNGPLGLFERATFAHGTKTVAQTITRQKKMSLLCGGDTEKVVKMYRLAGKFSHVSTGGGASLELLAGHKLPAVEKLPNK